MPRPAEALKTATHTEAFGLVPVPSGRDLRIGPDGETLSLLRELVEQVKGLRADLARDRRPSHLTRADRDRLARTATDSRKSFP
jgi:hypothetical protein